MLANDISFTHDSNPAERGGEISTASDRGRCTGGSREFPRAAILPKPYFQISRNQGIACRNASLKRCVS